MSDDITRQRFWSENARKPDPVSRRPRVPRSRSKASGYRSTVDPTHVLMVRKAGQRAWFLVRDGRHDVQGSEAFCEAERATRARHWPDDEFRVLTWPEARRELRRKAWSVHDADHISNGERVMLAATPEQLHPSLKVVRSTFGLSSDAGAEHRRYGVVKSRNRRSGEYMVRIEGSGLSVCVSRADLFYPVPENIVAFERKSG